MNNKRIAFLIMALAICISLITGCNSNNQQLATPQAGKQQPAQTQTPDQQPVPAQTEQPQSPSDNTAKKASDRQIPGSEYSIYVEGSQMTVAVNIERSSTDYWEYNIASGKDVFELTEDNPPGKVAQDGHSWIFEALKPGTAVIEFTLFDGGNNTPNGTAYSFIFHVDDSLGITSDSEYEDITSVDVNNDVTDVSNDDPTDMFRTILREVYESEVSTFDISPYTHELLGKDVNIYTATCENGRSCQLTEWDENTVYINESPDTANFKRIILGNMIVIGECINDYSFIDYGSFAKEIADKFFDDVLAVEPSEGDTANVFIDHRQVRVYNVLFQFDVGGYVAFDDDTENIFVDVNANGKYRRVIRDLNTDEYVVGEEVSVTPGM